MKLTHPDEQESNNDEQKHDHPITPSNVEQAHSLTEPTITVNELHDRLEVLQSAFENEFIDPPVSIYDELDMFGKVAHLLQNNRHASPYPKRLFVEDGKHGFDDKERRRLAVASSQAQKELDDPTHEEFEERYMELFSEVDIDDYTKEEQEEAFGRTFNVWKNVSHVFDIERAGDELKAIKAAHEIEYSSRFGTHTEYGETGFVIGIPRMFWSGMRTEQRLFSAIVGETELTPAQIVDAYGSRVSYINNSKWASKRGVSKSAVSQSRTKAMQKLNQNYSSGTIPENLGRYDDR